MLSRSKEIIRDLTDIVDPVVLASRARYQQVFGRNCDPRKHQLRSLRHCLRHASKTRFGRDHNFDEIESYEDFKASVPIRKHSELTPYIDAILAGQSDVLWPGTPKYLLYTGGTTSGQKQLIPVTEEGIRITQLGSLHSVLFYMADVGSSRVTRGKQVIIGASWEGERHACGAEITKISGAGPASVPNFIRQRMVIPSEDVASEPDFQRKLELIVRQALRSDISQVSSMPIWLVTFFEMVGEALNLTEQETLRQVWRDLELVLYTGASIKPYRHRFERWLGDDITLWEQYCATEGFVAAKETRDRDDMLVIPDINCFYEFVPIEEYGSENPTRLGLWQVEPDVDYVMVMTNPNGLFAYELGDTVRFTSVRPYRLFVSGRASLYLNTMGEHIRSEAIESTLAELERESSIGVVELTVGPGSAAEGETLHHDWVIECQNGAPDVARLERRLDNALRRNASDYDWLRSVQAMGSPSISIVPKGTFAGWIREYRGDDPQVKVPKVRNDRVMIEQLQALAA